MNELRILSGLHRGATLPLDAHAHVIGASEEADVVLVDPGIVERHASLEATESGWLLSAMDGTVLSSDSNHPQSVLEFATGDFVRVGDVWLTVVEQDAPWRNPPPEPVDEPFDATQLDATQPEDPEPMPVVDDARAEVREHAEPADDTAAESVSAPDVAAAAATPEQAMSSKKGRRGRSLGRLGVLGHRLVYLALAAIGLTVVAAYAITSRPETAMRKSDAAGRLDDRRHADGKAVDPTVAAARDALNPTDTPQRPLSQDELRKAFRKRLADAGLLKHFDLNLLSGDWSMQASLDDEEAARFERVLAAFVKQHNITFPINVKIGSAENMLPFKIQQVISGANASVVTTEGDRLYVGDEFRGTRLASIEEGRVTFMGKRKIEVRW